MKIRVKLGLFAGLLTLATAAAVSWLGFGEQRRLIESRQAEARELQSAGFASVCRQALTVDNELFMVNFARLLTEQPGILYAYFTDASGRILVHSDSRYIRRPLSDWRKPLGSLETAAPVALGRAPAGTAVIGFSEEHDRRLVRQALDQSLAATAKAAGAVAALGLAAALGLTILLTRPLAELARGSDRVAQGRFDVAIPVRGRDEIGDLARRFNSMAKHLSELDELKDEFISNVSHDLRNPMAAMQMLVEMLLTEEKDSLNPRQVTALATVVENAKRLGLLVNNVLDAAKIKAGRMEYHLSPVDLGGVAQNLSKLFGVVAERKGLLLMADIPLDLPPVVADGQQLEQVLANLVSNALKFTRPGGRVEISARAVEGRVDVRVADSGPGIAAEELPHLFQRFNQLGVAEQKERRIKGTGLGLYIVRRNVEGMGGAIRVESELGRGTSFTVALPAAPATVKENIA